jgi:hypothetical protein
MGKQLTCLLLISVFVLSFGFVADRQAGAQTHQMPGVMHMKITGEIAKTDNGYIIRGTTPAEVFTILNPEPDMLDSLVTSGRKVHIEAKIVSGDNLEIEKIDGKNYGKVKKSGKQ